MGDGLRINRYFTEAGANPLDSVKWSHRDSRITNPDGSTVFEMKDAEVPASWSQVAADIMVSKYFRKAGVPQQNDDGTWKVDDQGRPVLGPERSAKQVVTRLAATWRAWGDRYGYFATDADGQAFEDELVYMLVNQVAAPNSPQWFNTGLNHMYGLTGPAQGFWYVDQDTGQLLASPDSYSRPAPHACFIQSVSDDLVSEGGIMDLWTREARLFKFGSGTGTNFSTLRSENEPLSGGGKSSGVMSFLKIGDRAAGAIKSGGTTRRAAKMVILDIDHPDIEEFINWKKAEEDKVRALIAAGYPSDFNGEAYQTVSGQNSNNSVRVTEQFIKAVEQDGEWELTARTDPSVVMKTVKARDLWRQIAEAAWACADPGIQFDTTINQWHTSPAGGRIRASNPCSEYMFLDNTACNLASLNLVKFYDEDTKSFDIEGYQHAIRLWTMVLEISVAMAHFPSKEIAQGSFDYRTLGLGYANLGSMLMRMGIPYDSDEGRAITGAVTAILTGESYVASSDMAQVLGPFPRFAENRESMLRVMRNHRRAAYGEAEYEGVTHSVMAIDPELCPDDLLKAAQDAWDRAVISGEEHGFRNAQATVLAPTGTIGLLMDCDTTGVEPDFALVKFKKLAGGGYFKIANQSIDPALRALGYDEIQRKEMVEYVVGTLTLDGAPHINRETLIEKGLTEEELDAVEATLPGIFELRHAFNAFVLGGDAFARLGFEEPVYTAPDFDFLSAIGFTRDQIVAAEQVICGMQTIEGAPYLAPEHLPVFDTANKNGRHGERFIHHTGHIKAMAAAQPFISGAISKTINMPNEVDVSDIEEAYAMSAELGLKAMALYRDGSKASQPLSSSASEGDVTEDEPEELTAAIDIEARVVAGEIPKGMSPTSAYHAASRPRFLLPARRGGWTQEAKVGGHKIFLRTGEYDDGTLGEVFIDLAKEGATLRGILGCFAIAVSKGLQYGVPLEEFVESFTFQTFEPRGLVEGHPNIKMSNSIIDYVFRALGLEYLDRTDLVQVPPKDVGELPEPPSGLAVDAGIQLELKDDGAPTKPSAEIEIESSGVAVEVAEKTMPATAPISHPAVARDVPIEANGNGHHTHKQDAVRSAVAITTKPTAQEMQTASIQQALGEMMGDAPLCDTCGHITVRNGSCYRCLNCGHSMGCS
jgi:ribonucleoside-diphosphate reductase alpha chain